MIKIDKKEIKMFKDITTPLYYYDLALLRQTIKTAKKEADKYGYQIHYAIKANNNKRILEVVQNEGLGADCVSGQEIELAMQEGFQPHSIFFAGVGKTDEEIQLALKNEILCFNIESIQELEVVGHWAKELGRRANIALRINPNVNANTHHYITTGLEENKFGVFSHEIKEALRLIDSTDYLNFVGLHFHVGSQITDLNVFKSLCLKVNEWNSWFFERGYDLPILNLGGGLGINYNEPEKESIPDFKSFFQIFSEFLEPRATQKIHFELGRSLVGNCGSLIAKVLYIKKGKNKNFAILDAGMTELLRPALYQAYHKIEKLTTSTIAEETYYYYDVVGPICESSDYFGKAVWLPELKRGDWVAIRSAGAYGEVMSSRYNLRKELNFYYKE